MQTIFWVFLDDDDTDATPVKVLKAIAPDTYIIYDGTSIREFQGTLYGEDPSL